MNTQDRVYKAIIFDLDGVLVDTSEYHFQAWERLAEQLGIPFSREIYQEMKGMSRFDSLDYLIQISDIYLTDAEKLFRANIKNNWYIELISQLQPDALLPGVLDFLKKCKSLGLKMAVVSSSRNARTVLQSVGVIEYFDEVIDGTMIKNAKPDPDRYFLLPCNSNPATKTPW
ncbi:MAG: HAD hydrolase-like protein [Saprospiraceae bacterium]